MANGSLAAKCLQQNNAKVQLKINSKFINYIERVCVCVCRASVRVCASVGAVCVCVCVHCRAVCRGCLSLCLPCLALPSIYCQFIHAFPLSLSLSLPVSLCLSLSPYRPEWKITKSDSLIKKSIQFYKL